MNTYIHDFCFSIVKICNQCLNCHKTPGLSLQLSNWQKQMSICQVSKKFKSCQNVEIVLILDFWNVYIPKVVSTWKIHVWTMSRIGHFCDTCCLYVNENAECLWCLYLLQCSKRSSFNLAQQRLTTVAKGHVPIAVHLESFHSIEELLELRKCLGLLWSLSFHLHVSFVYIKTSFVTYTLPQSLNILGQCFRLHIQLPIAKLDLTGFDHEQQF